MTAATHRIARVALAPRRWEAAALALLDEAPTRDAPKRLPDPAAHAAVSRTGGGQAGLGALAVGALGIVFGDIGTSPLYAVEAVFGGRIAASAGNVRGVFSLLVWTLTLVVSVKYLTLVMRADNDGEGGIMARRSRRPTRWRSSPLTRPRPSWRWARSSWP